jgi:hypothetical protein
MIPRSSRQVALGTETTGHVQIMNAFGAPFMLEGLFSEADAEAMDADPDPKLAADNMGMDVEGDHEVRAGSRRDGR